MANPLIQVIDLETGEEEIREMTDKEFADHQNTLNIIAEDIKGFEAKAKAKADLLEKLGITEDEAKLLLA